MRFWELVRLAFGSLRRTRLRVVLTVMGIAIASGCLVSMVGFALGLQERAESSLEKLQLLQTIQVRPRRGKAAAPGLDRAAIRRLAALPGVAAAYPDFRLARLRVSRGAQSFEVRALGLPVEMAGLGFFGELLAAGRYFRPPAAHEVILSARVAARLGLAPAAAALGRRVTLHPEGLAPEAAGRFRFEKRELEVEVVGIFEPPAMGFGFGGSVIILPVDLIADLPGSALESALGALRDGRGGVDGRAVVRVKRLTDLARVQKLIEELGFETSTVLANVKEMRIIFLILDFVLTAVGTVALLVAGLGIANTQFIAVLERRQEIGLLKALGATDGDIRVLFLGEAGLVGVAGGLGGLALGALVSWGLAVVVNEYARRMDIPDTIAVFSFPPWLLGGVLVFAVGMSVLSGVYPAARAARLDPILSLRSD